MTSYYRVTKEVHEPVVLFQPKAVYEQIRFDGTKWFFYEGEKKGFPLEICFSKGIANAFLAICMYLKENEVYSIYQTEEEPCIDLEKVLVGDFRATREVRYLRPVKATKIGTLTIDSFFLHSIVSLYNESYVWEDFDCDYALNELNQSYNGLTHEITWEEGYYHSVL